MEEFNKREKFHIILRCSHKIHPACYESLKKSCTDNDKKINCSLCRKSIICPLKLESFYDKKKTNYNFISNNDTQVGYYCNDCNTNGMTDYHPKYIKCQCKSYNTESTRTV